MCLVSTKENASLVSFVFYGFQIEGVPIDCSDLENGATHKYLECTCTFYETASEHILIIRQMFQLVPGARALVSAQIANTPIVNTLIVESQRTPNGALLIIKRQTNEGSQTVGRPHR